MKKQTELIHDYFAGELTDAEHQQLQAWLETDPGHVKQFVREAYMNRQLSDVMASQKAQGLPLCDPCNISFDGRPDVGSSFFSSLPWGGVLPTLTVFLAVSLIGGLIWFANSGSAPQNEPQLVVAGKSDTVDQDFVAVKNAVASIEPIGECAWQFEEDGASSPTVTSQPARVGAGKTLRFLDGKARVSFDCGAVLTVTGPTVLKVDSKMDATLLSGNVSAMVSQEAIGFLLHTEEMDVRDLGTEFNVSVVPNGDTKVEVLDGEVEADLVNQTGKDKETVSLTQGQYLRASDEASSALDRLTFFRGTRIDFDKPNCLDLFEIRNPNPDHCQLDCDAKKLLLDTTWGSIYARDGVGNNLFLLPISDAVDFDVILTVSSFLPISYSDHVGVVCMADEDNHVRIIYAMGDGKRCGRYIKYSIEKAGTPFQQEEYPADFNDQPFKLRLTRRGNEISSWWSTDGQNWIFRDKSNAPQNVKYVGFYVSKGHRLGKDTPVYERASIESFEVEYGK